MFKLHDTVMYGTTGVCTVESIENKKIGRDTKQYYVLKPKSQCTSTVFIPIDNENLLSKVRKVLSNKEVELIIDSIDSNTSVWVDNDAERRVRFSEIIQSGDRKQCLCLLYTLKRHQRLLSEKGKRLHIADERALKESERLIYDEFSFALGVDAERISEYIKKRFEQIY